MRTVGQRRASDRPRAAFFPLASAIFVTVAVASAPTAAVAFDDELQLGADLSYAYQTGGGAAHGFGAGLRARYGLTDAVAIAGTVSWFGHPWSNEGATGLDHLISADVGAIYALDVFQVVPYFGLLVGAAARIEEQSAAYFLLHVVGGFDVLWTREFSTGLEVGYELLVGSELYPARILVGIRLSWHKLL